MWEKFIWWLLAVTTGKHRVYADVRCKNGSQYEYITLYMEKKL